MTFKNIFVKTTNAGLRSHITLSVVNMKWPMCPPFCSKSILFYIEIEFLIPSKLISSHFSRLLFFSSFSLNGLVRPS